MYVAVVPNRGSPPAILLRESYREAGKTKNRTLANLSRWPAERIEQLRAVLRGDKLLPAAEAVEIIRALPHGHVLAALGTARRIALDAVLPRRASQRRGPSAHGLDPWGDLALALIVARLLEPAAKLATARMLDPATACHSLGEMLGLGKVTAKEVYAALDWLGREQPFIEAKLARRHLKDGALLLYDVTSTYLEGRCCELAQHGYSRDHRGDRPQIVIGLMCAADGCPVAVEVFEGNTADPLTLSAQIDKLKPRFKLQRVVMVVGLQPTNLIRGDRGNRPGRRGGTGTAPHGQAFPHQHHRRYLQLRPKPPQHRRRGRARRHLCDPHQSAGRTIRCGGHGACLQKSQRRRARLPLAEDRRSRAASGVPLDCAAGARPRLAVHVGLLSAVAHAPEPRPNAVRRARSGRPRGTANLTGGQGRALAGGATQGRAQTHPARRGRTDPGAQLPHPTRRSCHAHPQSRPPWTRSPHRHPRHPPPHPAPRPPPSPPHPYRVDSPTPPAAN